MRSEGKHVKKKEKKRGRGCFIFAGILFFIALCVALVLGGFIMWVMYGEEGDGKSDSSTKTEETEKKEIQTVTVDVSKKWSVPSEAFDGTNGYGRFVSDNVKNKVSLSSIRSEMGIDEKTKEPSEKKRIEAVKRFLDGLYYECDKDEGLSNGDDVTVYIRSKEEPAEIESEANIVINGIGEHKNVTVSGLAVKLTYNEVNGRDDLLKAAVKTAKKKIKKADGGHHKKIFADEDKYDVRFEVYGIYLAKPYDPSRDDGLVVMMRLIHKYPDKKYIYWTKEGDDVYQYEMCHFMGLDSNTTVEDIEEDMVYDMFKYRNKVDEGFTWYREEMDQKSKYYLQQLTYNG
ncbi:MAG: hypothetical protein IJH41_02470 [Eubacterium sp.]|nr:hypothetical protein [Eubacterium sp.]